MIPRRYIDEWRQNAVNLRLKLEINCREHFSVLGKRKNNFESSSTWFEGGCSITSFELEELLGTKLRALYQRRKGRDLFDIYHALKLQSVDIQKLLHCYNEYMAFAVKKPPSKKQFRNNLFEKINDKEFEKDIIGLLRPEINYDQNLAYQFILDKLL